MATPLPGDPGYIPIEIPKMTMGFEDWIAITAAQGMPGWEQLGLWRVINPAVTIELVSRARCRAGFHDDHGEDNTRGCWADYEPDEKPSRGEERAGEARETDE
jgi:hypothetical protein